MQGLTPLSPLLVVLALAGCAVVARAGLWSEITDIRTAFEAAAAERDRLCVDEPARCRQRLRLAPDRSPAETGSWSYELAPSYRAEFDVTLEHLRPALRRIWLGLDYWNAITRALADEADAATIGERDAWLVTRQVREQTRRMMIAQIDHHADRPGDAAAWRAAAVTVLARAVVELNAYTAAHTHIGEAASGAGTPEPGCTVAVAVLRGRALCVTADGGAVAR
jgi:hypothetical protein